ncbi:MAG: efflux RND transporter periplasmic adaptor subunit [Acidobacteriota bacterium]
MSRSARIWLPIVVLALGAAAAAVIIIARPRVERREIEVPAPLVRVVRARERDVPLNVLSQGTVEPRTESVLVAQVGGRIEWVSPAFAEGSFFWRGEPLVRIDPRDYRLAVSRAEAQVAQARVRLEMERAEAAVARREWDELGEGEPTALTLRRPQLAEAEAALRAAEAALEQARLDLERTRVRAPYAGRVRDRRADIGQFVSPGTPLAVIYATDYAEIRLPVSRHDLAFLEIDLGASGRRRPGPPVLLRGEIGGAVHTWTARVVRTDSAFDPKTRMLDLFARVEDPFRRRADFAGPPLPKGLFLQAEIGGRVARGVFVLPRAALRGDGRVLVVDDESRLRLRAVELLRVAREEAIVRRGLEEGEMVCVSPLETVVDGMRVRTVLEGEAGPDGIEVGEGA